MNKAIPDIYVVADLDNSCGDPDCCDQAFHAYSVYLPVRGWVGHFQEHEKAERMARLCKRWGVK